MTMQRRIDLDAAKGWGILLVVLGHASSPEWATTVIYSFHMPLFFIISGLLWKDRVQPSGVFKSLMWPFYWGSLITWPLWVFKVLIVKSDMVPLWGPLLATIYGGNLFGYFVHNTALWFLPSLFVMYMIIWLLTHFFRSRQSLSAILFGLGWIVLLASPFMRLLCELPLSIGQGMVGGMFFAVGLTIPNMPLYRLKEENGGIAKWFIYVVVFIFFSLTAGINGRVDLFSMQFGAPLLYFINGLLGSALLLVLCRQPVFQWEPICMIGEHSLQVLIFHQPVFWILRFLLIKVNVHPNWIALTVATILLFLLAFKLQNSRGKHAAQRLTKEI